MQSHIDNTVFFHFNKFFTFSSLFLQHERFHAAYKRVYMEATKCVINNVITFNELSVSAPLSVVFHGVKWSMTWSVLYPDGTSSHMTSAVLLTFATWLMKLL